jgi:hypothetical protein
MLPRMPMAAGTMTIRPGSASRVPVMDPNAIPAARLPMPATSSATKPCEIVRRSARQ